MNTKRWRYVDDHFFIRERFAIDKFANRICDPNILRLWRELLVAGARVEEQVLNEFGHLLYLFREIVEVGLAEFGVRTHSLSPFRTQFSVGGPGQFERDLQSRDWRTKL